MFLDELTVIVWNLINFKNIFRRQRKSFAKALYLNQDRIPDERKQFLQQELLKHYPTGTEITNELLMDAIDTETGYVNSYQSNFSSF